MSYDWLVVGAGFAGSVLAERLASRGDRVLVVDRRPHVGGNAYDRTDAAGILIHQYGPHIFHTNSDRIVGLSVAFHRLAPLRAPGAGEGGRPAAADPDQPRHGEPALRPRPRCRRRWSASSPRGARRSTRCGRRRMSSSRPSGASSTRSSSAATPASSGASTRRSCRSRSRRASPFGRTTTTATSPTASRRCRGGLHAHVRTHARPSGHRPPAGHGLPADPRPGVVPPAGLHGADRRVLRLPAGQAALPLAPVPACDARRGMGAARGSREPSAGRGLHACHGVQAPHRAAPPTDAA